MTISKESKRAIKGRVEDLSQQKSKIQKELDFINKKKSMLDGRLSRVNYVLQKLKDDVRNG